jgi:hypothetical protein
VPAMAHMVGSLRVNNPAVRMPIGMFCRRQPSESPKHRQFEVVTGKS